MKPTIIGLFELSLMYIATKFQSGPPCFSPRMPISASYQLGSTIPNRPNYIKDLG